MIILVILPKKNQQFDLDIQSAVCYVMMESAWVPVY